MKRIFSIVLLFLYLIAAIGVNGSVHYCGGKLSSVSLKLLGSGYKCACGSKKMKKDCCQDKAFSFHLDDDQNKTPQLVLNVVNSPDALSDFVSTSYFQNAPFFAVTTFSYKHQPPDHVKQPLFVLNRVFLI